VRRQSGRVRLIVSRTGYTGEKMAFELFVHPERAADFWNAVLKTGEKFGVKPVGLGHATLFAPRPACRFTDTRWARLGKTGERDLGVGEAGFGALRQDQQTLVHRTGALWPANRPVRAWSAASSSPRRVSAWPTTAIPCWISGQGDRLGHQLRRRPSGTLTGQAYVELNTPWKPPDLRHQSAGREAGIAPAELKLGDKGLVPTEASC